MIGALILSYILFPVIYYALKLVSRIRKKKKPDSGTVLICTFLIVNIAWIGAFICQFFCIGGIGGEIAFLFIAIPTLIILLGLIIAA